MKLYMCFAKYIFNLSIEWSNRHLKKMLLKCLNWLSKIIHKFRLTNFKNMFFNFSRSLERSFANSIRYYSKPVIKKSKMGEYVGYEPYQMEMLQKEFLSSIILIKL